MKLKGLIYSIISAFAIIFIPLLIAFCVGLLMGLTGMDPDINSQWFLGIFIQLSTTSLLSFALVNLAIENPKWFD